MSSPSARQQRWPEQAVVLVTDRHLVEPERWPEVIAAALDGGVNVVQLREKDLPAGELLTLARQLRGMTIGRARLIINDRADVALLCGADGVHLGEASLPVAPVRNWLPRSMVVGRSVHDINGARQAEQDGATYLVLGSVFASASKPDVEPGGIELIQSVASRVDVPVVAIGGITGDNARQCWEAGARGVAAISGLLGADDPRGAAAALAPEE